MILDGVRLIPGFLSPDEQQVLLEEIRNVVRAAPLYVPRMPKTGKSMSVRMTNCGPLGWVSDQKNGYRYQENHPVTGKPWPPMPALSADIWQSAARYHFPPEACLINFYDEQARMGLHQDRDEKDFDAPVVSISFGDDALFRIGGEKRGGSTNSFRLASGDVLVLGGPARLAFHGIDRIYPGTSMLLKNGGRINLTLRRVTKPETNC